MNFDSLGGRWFPKKISWGRLVVLLVVRFLHKCKVLVPAQENSNGRNVRGGSHRIYRPGGGP